MSDLIQYWKDNHEWLAPLLASLAIIGGGLAWVINLLKAKPDPGTAGVDLAIKALIARLQEKMGEVADKDQQIRQLKETVEALKAQSGPGIAEAMAELATGNTAKAEAIFRRVIDAKTEEGGAAYKQAAAAARHLGALAYLHDTDKALVAYRQAVNLDPDDADGWNQLGHLLRRIGSLDEAVKAYEKVLTLGNQVKDKSVIAMALGNLGNVYQTRGDLDKAEEFYLKSLAIEKELGGKEGMASDYGNLGLIYKTRGDLDKAEEFLLKALALHKESTVNKPG